MLDVYKIDDDEILMGDGAPRQMAKKGDRCVLVVPPARPAGKLARWVTELDPVRDALAYGDEGTGEWAIKDDYRKIALYQTADGAAYTLKAETDQGAYPGYGELPAWLTDVERPSQFHDWVGSAWVLDAQAKLDNDKKLERAWRDGEISKITWLRDRHRDEVEQGLPTTLTSERYGELVVYIQALRDWTAAEAFPAPASRPTAPDWLAI